MGGDRGGGVSRSEGEDLLSGTSAQRNPSNEQKIKSPAIQNMFIRIYFVTHTHRSACTHMGRELHLHLLVIYA